MRTTSKTKDIKITQDDDEKRFIVSDKIHEVEFKELYAIDLKLFLFIISKVIANTEAASATSISVSVSEYQKLTGLKSYTNTKEQMQENLNRLAEIRVAKVGTDGEKLFASVKKEKGKFTIIISKNFFSILTGEGAFKLYLPAKLFEIDMKKNELAFFVGYELFVFNRCRLSHRNKKRNSQKQDAYKISLNTLTEACPNLPVADKHKHARIIKPVEDALQMLQNIQILKKLDIEESEKENFNGWKKKFVSFSFADYISEKQKDCLPKMFHKPRKKKQNNLSVSVVAGEELKANQQSDNLPLLLSVLPA